MANSDLSIRLGVDGERDFKNALRDINQSFKVLGSEMTLVSSQFDRNDKSVAALTSRNTVLRKEIDAQKDKVETLKNALDYAATSFGESDKRTQNWQIQLNKAQAELNGMERELGENEKALDEVGGEMQDTAKNADKLGDEVSETGNEANESGKKFEKLGGVLKSVGVAIGAAMVAIGTAAVAAGKKMYDMANDTAAACDNIDKQSQRLGMSRETFQEWDYVLSQNGVSIDTMNTAMKSMTAAMSDLDKGGKKGQETLAKLGVTTNDLKNLKQEEIFEKAVVALQKMPEGYEKARLSQQLFGKQGQEMLPMLNTSKGTLDELKEKAHEYGMVMSDDAVAAGVKFTDSLDTLKHTFAGVKNSISSQLLPGLTQITDGLAGLISGNKEAAESIKAGAKSVISSISEVLPQILNVLMSIVEAVAEIAPEIITTLINGISSNLPTLMKSAAAIITALLSGIIGALPALAEGAVALVMTLLSGILDNLPALLEAAIQVVVTLVQGISAALPQLIPAIVQTVVTMVTALIDNLPMILDAALQLIIGLTQGILNALPVLISALPAIIIGIVNFMISSIPQIIDAGIKLLISIVGALPQIIQSIVAAIPKIITGLVNAIVGNIDKIIAAGVQLLIALVKNTPQIIAGVIKAVPQIISGIIRALLDCVPQLAETGLNLIKGLWQGISNAGAWLRDKIAGFFGGVVSSIKKFFGINSPSTLFRDEFGKNMALGVGVGFVDEMNSVSKEMQNAIPTSFDVPDFDINAGINTAFSASGTFSLSDIVGRLDALSEIMLKVFDVRIVLDDGTLVGRLAPEIDRELGLLRKRGLAY